MGKAAGEKVFAQRWSLAYEERKLSFPKADAENSRHFSNTVTFILLAIRTPVSSQASWWKFVKRVKLRWIKLTGSL